jgi:hypothetical protein
MKGPDGPFLGHRGPMTAGYDEWAAARTPSLIAFAVALVGDVQVADAAVARALDRTRAAWARVSRDDPDLEARRQVVRACATPRRAAVVLRVLEDRSDAEIGEVLRCSEAAVRRNLQRGFAELGPAFTSEDALPAVRDDLVARVDSAPAQLLTRVPTSTRTGRPPAPRHRAIWLACLSVLALVCGVALVAHESGTPAGAISYPKVAVPGSWRYESYAGVQLEVPDTFGWGAAPIESSIFASRRHLGSCGANEASVLSPADESSYVSSLTRFVGRPAILTDRCVMWGADGSMPRGEAVWFGSPLAVGVRQLGGNVAETRAIGGQHVTVFGPDSQARRQILGTAEEVTVDDNGCPTKAVSLATTGPPNLEPDSLSVCVYSQDSGAATLMYSGALPGPSASAYAAHVASVTTSGGDQCGTVQGQWVALGLHGVGGTRWDVANLGCHRVQLANRRTAPVTPATVRDWAVRGVTAYVGAPAGSDPALKKYFQTPIG